MLTWSNGENDEFWNNDQFETVEECIADAKENYCVELGEEIAIGTVVPIEPSVDIDSILERMEEDAYEQCGEASESWDISSSKDREQERQELQEKINTLVYEYIKKIGETPTFYAIEDIYTVEIK